MIFKHFVLALCFVTASATGVFAFEVVDEKQSYENLKFLSLRLGMGAQTFIKGDDVDGSLGPAFEMALGHQFRKGLDFELLYQFSSFNFESPDPIVLNQPLRTRTGMHSQILRSVFYIPTTMGQPFVSVGVGGYFFSGLDAETTLDFGYGFQVPVGVGFRGFFLKNKISVQFEYMYHVLLGDNQADANLALLNRNSFGMDAYTLMGSFGFYFF